MVLAGAGCRLPVSHDQRSAGAVSSALLGTRFARVTTSRLETCNAVLDELDRGRLALDGRVLIDIDDDSIRERRRLMHHGQVAVTVVFDVAGKVSGAPIVNAHGLAGGTGEGIAGDLAAEVARALSGLTGKGHRDNSAVEQAARRAVNRLVRATTGKRPLIDVNVVRMDQNAVPGAAQKVAS